MRGKRRDRLQIIHDILNAVREKNGKIGPTNILYKSNLSNKMFLEYMDELLQKQLLMENVKKGKKMYSLTENGFAYLEKYSTIVEFTDSFGLSE